LLAANHLVEAAGAVSELRYGV